MNKKKKKKKKEKENGLMFNGFSNDKPLRLRIVSIRDDSICLEWNCSEFDADRYQVYMKIADDKNQINISNKWHLIYQGKNTNYTVPNLLSDTEYLFRARYQCLYGMSPWPKAKKSKTLKNEKKNNLSIHPPILSNIQLAIKQKELKKQQKKNRKENKKQRAEQEKKRKKQNQENRRRKEAANKRRKKEAKQRAKEQQKRKEEEEYQKKLELEAEEKRLYDQALIERLRQIELEKKENEKKETKTTTTTKE